VPCLLSGDGWLGSYGTPFAMRFLPTASERLGEHVLLTLGSGDGIHRAGDLTNDGGTPSVPL
jgi:hypothetical protein